MRKVSSRGGRTVVATSGKHGIALALQWPEHEYAGLLGFAVRRTDPTRTDSWLKTVLRFEGESIEKGKLYNASEAPIQSFVWADFGLEDDKSKYGLPAGSRFVYEVIPVRGKPGKLQLKEDEAVHIAISTEPEHDHGSDKTEVHFNRGLSQMQEYERLFGEGHQPDDDPVALDWLARDLDEIIIAYINQAVADDSLRLDVAAYHLDHPGVIDAICQVGPRARVSMDWGSLEVTKPPSKGPNGKAFETLTKHDVFVHQRKHVAISHNKYMVLKNADGSPKSVLTGSTNFTNGGIATQSNQSVIVHNKKLAQKYLKDFELVLKNDNDGLRDFNHKGAVIDETLEVYFSPHHSSERPDLDRLTQLAQQAKSSRLFMTFRMTDRTLIDAMLDDSVSVFGVADRVYRGKKETSGDRAIFNEAFTDDPRVVACNFPLDDEPEEDVLFDELKRGTIEPIVHHKLLLLDWDTPNCIVATGSANYSSNSTKNNDENTLIVHGAQRLTEEYFVEFCRLFTHWQPRWLRERHHQGAGGPEHLAADSSWTEAWAEGGRLAQFLALTTGGAQGNAESNRVGAVASAPPPKIEVAPKAVTTLAGKRIDHIVVLMLENRSFDHMLGLLPGVEGVQLDADGKDPHNFNFADPQKPKDDEQYFVRKAKFFGIPEGDIPPPKYDPKNLRWSMYGGPSHSFPPANEQLFNDKWGPTGRDAKGNTPKIGPGFVKSYIDELMQTYKAWQKADPKFNMPDEPLREHVDVVMSAFSPDQVPVISGLAQEFAVCDHWFSEVPGPTEPNRLFMHAATSVGLVHNPWEFPIKARTIYEDIDEVAGRTWAFYYYDLADANNFPAIKTRTELIRPFTQFHTDLNDPESFPNYVFLCPKYWNTKEGHSNSQHAPYDVRYGEHWIADVYEALRNSDIWENTLLIITYDEHGGFYDHVQPPDKGVLPPDDFVSPTAYDKTNYGYMFSHGHPKQEYIFNFDRLGCRVPAVLVSPWIKKGAVVSDQLQHTSVLATVRKMWGLRDRPLTKREGQAKRFDHLLEALDEPRTDCPKKLKRPPLPKVSLSAAADQPLSPVQWEIFNQVNHLDGHDDSGKPAPPPKTQGEAAKYIKERTRSHRQFHKERKGNGRFAVYQDKQGKYRWRLLDATGEIIASSGEGFATLSEAEAEIIRVRELANGAGLDETDI